MSKFNLENFHLFEKISMTTIFRKWQKEINNWLTSLFFLLPSSKHDFLTFLCFSFSSSSPAGHTGSLESPRSWVQFLKHTSSSFPDCGILVIFTRNEIKWRNMILEDSYVCCFDGLFNYWLESLGARTCTSCLSIQGCSLLLAANCLIFGHSASESEHDLHLLSRWYFL